MRPPPTVADRVLDEPWSFDFFQAVRLLERVYSGRRPVGEHADPRDEAVRFKTHNSLSFPASDIQSVRSPSEAGGGPAEMVVNFMGVTGPAGAMPRHYTVVLGDRTLKKETKAAGAFLDIFNHRFVSLFYRAWRKYRFFVAYERGEGDRFSQYLLSLMGLGTAGLQKRLAFTDEVLLYYSGLLAQRPRSAAGLEQILRDYFDAPIRVQQFTGEWFLMNPDALSRIGDGGWNQQLGVNTVLWQQVFDPQARFRILVGPLGWRRFQDFLPDGEAYGQMVDLARFFAGDDLNFEIQPLADPAEIPLCAVGETGGMRLGWSMWLHAEPLAGQVPQPVFGAHVSAQLESEGTTT